MTAQMITFPLPGTALADPMIRASLGVLRHASDSAAHRAGVAMLESIAGKITVGEFRWLVDHADRLPAT